MIGERLLHHYYQRIIHKQLISMSTIEELFRTSLLIQTLESGLLFWLYRHPCIGQI